MTTASVTKECFKSHYVIVGNMYTQLQQWRGKLPSEVDTSYTPRRAGIPSLSRSLHAAIVPKYCILEGRGEDGQV